MEDNIGLIWVLAGLIGFFINCGICYVISKPIEKYYKKRERNAKSKDKKLPQII